MLNETGICLKSFSALINKGADIVFELNSYEEILLLLKIQPLANKTTEDTELFQQRKESSESSSQLCCRRFFFLF